MPACASHAESRDGKPVCNQFNDFKGGLVIKNEKDKEMGCFAAGSFSADKWWFLWVNPSFSNVNHVFYLNICS